MAGLGDRGRDRQAHRRATPLAAQLLGCEPGEVVARRQRVPGRRSMTLGLGAVAAGPAPAAWDRASRLQLASTRRWCSRRARTRRSWRSSARPARCAWCGSSPSTTPARSSTRCSSTGQVLGGAVQALGECLVEEVVHDGDGQNHSGSLMDYSLLTAAEIPPIVTERGGEPLAAEPARCQGRRRGRRGRDAARGGQRGRRRARRPPPRPAVHRGEAVARAAPHRRAAASRANSAPMKPAPFRLPRAALAGRRPGAGRRQRRQGARGRPEPDPADELPARSPGAAGRPQPDRRARPTCAARRASCGSAR